jgi:putative hydrolase of the HAD superfamily
LNLNRYFSNIILSYKIGARKPGRLIYTQALEVARLKPEECMFIADEISDLEGAREIGIKTLLVRQGKSTLSEARNPDFKPDLECSRISEVPGVLSSQVANI